MHYKMLSVTRCGKAVRTVHHLNTWRGSFTLTAAASTHAYTPPRREMNVVYSQVAPVTSPEHSLPKLIFSRAQNWLDKDAMECGVTGRKYTYGGVVDRALRWGGVVSQLVSSSRTITLFCVNAPEFPILLLGSLAVGATVTTVSSNYTAEEVARQLEDSRTEMVVTDPQLEGLLSAALAKLNKVLPVFVNGDSALGHPNLRHIIEDDSKPFADPVESSPESTAIVLYSSGTTGPPKGVQLSHGAINSNLVNFTHPDFFAYHLATDGVQEVVSGVMPFYHVYGTYVVNLLSLFMGAKIVTLPTFTPQDFIRIIKDHKMRILHLVPPMLNFLTTSPAVTSADLASVQVAMCAAAPVPPSAAEALKEKAPNPILFQEGFGMTEALGTHMTPVKEETIGWCGKCVPSVEAKVVDIETGEALPEGERGELCIRSPSLMTGYFNNPAATAECFDAEGWFHTGDVAIHQDGFFSIVDRMKELIKVKGFQVSPSELEDVLLQHPGVADVAVVGVPDVRAGELPRAYIIRQKGTTEEDIHKFLEPRLAKYKQLKGGIRFVDTLPKNQTGKVLKRVLKEATAEDP